MKLIRTDLPYDAPTNPHPTASPECERWNEQARASTDYVLLIPLVPGICPMIIPYTFLSEYRRPIERGDARWVSVAALLELEESTPNQRPPHLPAVPADEIRAAIRGLQAVLEPQSIA